RELRRDLFGRQRPAVCAALVSIHRHLHPGDCMRADIAWIGGAGGIRTLDTALRPYNGLANRRLQPLGHSSVAADMPDDLGLRKAPPGETQSGVRPPRSTAAPAARPRPGSA